MQHDKKMVEQVSRAIAVGRGIDPDANLSYGEKPAWQYFVDDAASAVAAYREHLTGVNA